MPTALENLPSDDDEHLRCAAAHVGESLNGRWHLDSLLGVGGMASVYAATHRNGKQVAIKMLHPELSTNTGVRRLFIDEGYVANRVKHPGTVSVLDDGETAAGLVFLVMDLLDGQTLEERLRERNTLQPREVLAITEGLLDVLAAAHHEGIVHRDIKPANIFIMRDGTVRLLDFGIASLISPGHPRTTEWGVAMGTPSFMPPEQARGDWAKVDGRTDLWAVGATMFQALTGRPVHLVDTPNEELSAAMTRRAPSIGDIVPGTLKVLVNLVDRALAFESSTRWPGARAMQTALRAVQAELELQPVAKAFLVPRATWMAGTRSWHVLPMEESVSGISLTRAKRAPDRGRRGILPGAAAFVVAFVGHTGLAPPTHADASTPAPITAIQTAQAVDLTTSAPADAAHSGSPAPAPILAVSTSNKTRGTLQRANKAEVDERKVRNTPGKPAMPARLDRAPPPETSSLSRGK